MLVPRLPFPERIWSQRVQALQGRRIGSHSQPGRRANRWSTQHRWPRRAADTEWCGKDRTGRKRGKRASEGHDEGPKHGVRGHDIIGSICTPQGLSPARQKAPDADSIPGRLRALCSGIPRRRSRCRRRRCASNRGACYTSSTRPCARLCTAHHASSRLCTAHHASAQRIALSRGRSAPRPRFLPFRRTAPSQYRPATLS